MDREDKEKKSRLGFYYREICDLLRKAEPEDEGEDTDDDQ